MTKADPEGFEPSTAGLGGRCPILTRLRVLIWCVLSRIVNTLDLWGRADSNCRPSVPNARGWTKLPYYPLATFNERLTIKSCSRGAWKKSATAIYHFSSAKNHKSFNHSVDLIDTDQLS